MALGPSAMAELDRRGIPFVVPEDFASREEVEAECRRNFAELSAACVRLDDYLCSEIPALKEFELRPFEIWKWNLAARLDGIVSRVLTLERFFARFPNAAIVTQRIAKTDESEGSLEVAGRGHFWPLVLSLPEWRGAVRWLDDRSGNCAEGHPIGSSLRGKILSGLIGGRLRKSLWTNSLLESFRFGLVRNLIGTAVGRRGRKSILILGGVYDWELALGGREFSDFRVLFLSSVPEDLAFPCKDGARGEFIPDPVRVNHLFRKSFGSGKIDYLKLLEPEIAEFASAISGLVRRTVSFAKRLRERYQLQGILNAVSPTFGSRMLLNVFRSLGVTVFKWQHGAVWDNGGVTQRMDLIDPCVSDVLFVYGEGVKAAYETAGLPDSCHVHAVGSTRLDRLRDSGRRISEGRGDNPTKSRVQVLYVVTNYYLDDWYCGFSPPFSDQLYFRDQQALISGLLALLGAHRDLRLTVKLPNRHTVDYPPPWIEDVSGVPGTEVVAREESFSALLLKHDAVIIDSPTTVLLEALCLEKPIFVLLSAVGLSKEAIVLLRKRAVCVNEPEALIAAVTDYVKHGSYPANIKDEAFLRHYGTGAIEKRSAEIAASEVADCLANRRQTSGCLR